MKNTHLFVCFEFGRTTFRFVDKNGYIHSGTYLAPVDSTALDGHYSNLAGFVKQYKPNSVEIRNDLP